MGCSGMAVACGAALKACERGAQWQLAAAIFQCSAPADQITSEVQGTDKILIIFVISMSHSWIYHLFIIAMENHHFIAR